MPTLGPVRIGCSGWNYKAWRGTFYPEGLPVPDWLPHYATIFDTVEVNNTFYRLPLKETFEAWRAQTPPGFLMAVKASRYLTHLKRLRDPGPPLELLFERVAGLGNRLGPVLYQLPGHFHRDDERLESFLAALPRRAGATARAPRVQHVIEFRHPSWYAAEVFSRLDAQGVSLCLHDKLGAEISEASVGPILYVRFHGTSGHYHGSYGALALRHWAERIADAARAGQPCYAYFNNDPDAVATANALTLRSSVDELLADKWRT